MLTDKENNRIIGFAGCGQQECISGCALLFLAEYKKVLIMDFSEHGEMRNMIPLPSDLEEAKNIVLSYRKFDYVKAEGEMQIQDFSFDYDIVLVDFGSNLHHPEKEFCERIYYITDMCRHNILHLKSIKRENNDFLVLKNYMKEKGKAEPIAEELGFALSDFFVLPYEEKEAVQFLCESRIDEVNIGRFTSETKELLEEILKDGSEEPYKADMVSKGRWKLW